MKIMLLSGGKRGTHTAKWANGLAAKGLDVHLVTQQAIQFELDSSIKVHKLPFTGALGYYLNVLSVRKIFSEIKPDIVNAHYASGYGTLARLAKLKPLVLSVWGGDVYDFPERGSFFSGILKKNIHNAEAVASTSQSMANHVSKRFNYDKPIYITPFGVDTNFFKSHDEVIKDDSNITIGTVKTLSKKYGIDTLIYAFKEVEDLLGEKVDLSLDITGDGPDRKSLEDLVNKLNLSGKVKFHGFLNDKNEVLARILNLDIYVALSRFDSESFGVALLEASSCNKPLVVSDVSGPLEVVKDGVTGFVVPRDNPSAAAEKLCLLIEDFKLRKYIGRNGREHVVKNYSWEYSLENMIDVYREVVRHC